MPQMIFGDRLGDRNNSGPAICPKRPDPTGFVIHWRLTFQDFWFEARPLPENFQEGVGGVLENFLAHRTPPGPVRFSDVLVFISG